METKTVTIFGMKCGHCKANVENNLRKIPGIKEVVVDLQKQDATITADHFDFDHIRSVIEDLGYKFGNVY